MAGSMEHDLKVRVAEAWRTFIAGVFLDRGLRLQLLEPLIFPRLFFASGAWEPLELHQWQRLEHICTMMLRTLTTQRPQGMRR